jgi:dihydrofolate reductase
MGRLVINNAMTVSGAFEAPAPEPEGRLVLDADSNQASLEQFLVADAMVLGRKTYEGLAAVWPQLADDPTLGVFADRMNSMPKYVASRSLREPLEWNATLLEDDLAKSVTALKDRHDRTLVAVGAGELTHARVAEGWREHVSEAAREKGGTPQGHALGGCRQDGSGRRRGLGMGSHRRRAGRRGGFSSLSAEKYCRHHCRTSASGRQRRGRTYRRPCRLVRLAASSLRGDGRRRQGQSHSRSLHGSRNQWPWQPLRFHPGAGTCLRRRACFRGRTRGWRR